MAFLDLGDQRLDYRWIAAADPARGPGAPTLVFLHEGLGSVTQWRDFPDRLAAATGAPALVYARAGYGRSSRSPHPQGLDYMHRAALEELPAVLDALAITDPILIGHSDGASIALIYAGRSGRRCRGVVVEAPHVFVEPITLAGIRAAVAQWDRDPRLRTGLARHHDEPDRVFQTWHQTWLSPPFAAWNIENVLSGITCPLLAIQGLDDEYGTPAQIDAITHQVASPAHALLIPACAHTPHRDQPDLVLQAMAEFVRGL